jgi:hypothetical protein
MRIESLSINPRISVANSIFPTSVIARLPRPTDNPEPSKYYARWNGGHIEVMWSSSIPLFSNQGSNAVNFSFQPLGEELLLTSHFLKQVTDMLISKWICPADLRGEPCLHDRLAGCHEIRLCKVSEHFPNRPAFLEQIQYSFDSVLTGFGGADGGEIHSLLLHR